MGSTVRVGSRSWHETIARLFAALDDPDLLERLVNTIQEAIHVDNAIASVYCRDGRPIIFYNDWSAPEHSVNRLAVPRWVESAYLLDPFYRRSPRRGSDPVSSLTVTVMSSPLRMWCRLRTRWRRSSRMGLVCRL